MHDPRLARLADVLVNYSVAVKKGELVRIYGPVVSEPLLVEVFKAVLRAGGHPYVQLHSDACAEAFVKLAGDHQLDYRSPVAQREIETIDCMISAWGGENTRHLTNADPRKQARASAARKKWLSTFMRRTGIPPGGEGRLRWVGTQFPCQSSAQDAEMSLAEYEDFVFGAGLLATRNPAAAWRDVSRRQQRVADYLNRVAEVRFRTPQGTDLRVAVRGRRWVNCDGHANFPDGEVFTSPIEDATEGTVHYTFPAVHGGREVTDIRLRFRAGRVVEASASKNEDFLVKMLDQDRGARVLGEIAVGTNYSIRRHTKNTLFDEKIGGTFHAALGNAFAECGGKNQSGLHWDMVCDLRAGGVIEADGKIISRNGRFVNGTWPGPRRG